MSMEPKMMDMSDASHASELSARLVELLTDNAALREELAALRAHNTVIRDKANSALSDLSGLLSYQKINLDDGSYRFDGQAAFELGYAIQEAPAQSLAKVRADAIMSLCEHGNWDGREDGEYYYSASTIKKFAEEIEDGL